MITLVKTLHIGLAIATICGFLLRGYWMMFEPAKLQARAARILPHVADTAFLVTGIALLVLLRLQPMHHPWLIAKLLALVVYIAFGSIALKRGRTLRVRISALVIALLTFAYIVGVAISKSPAGWFAVA